MGHGDRAYMMGANTSKRTQRSPEHLEYLLSMVRDEGYLPHQWVEFTNLYLTKSEALRIEQKLIKKLSPRFNRKHGPNVMFSDDDIRKIKTLKEDGLSDTKISKIMNCSQTTISRIFSGTRSGYKEVSEY